MAGEFSTGIGSSNTQVNPNTGAIKMPTDTTGGRPNIREAENLGEQAAAVTNAKHGTLYRRETHPGLE